MDLSIFTSEVYTVPGPASRVTVLSSVGDAAASEAAADTIESASSTPGSTIAAFAVFARLEPDASRTATAGSSSSSSPGEREQQHGELADVG